MESPSSESEQTSTSSASSSHPVIRLSPTLERLSSELPDEVLEAGTFVQELFRRHPEYAGGRAEKFVDELVASGPARSPQVWLEAVRDLLEPERVGELHGRLLTVGLVVLEDKLGVQMAEAGLVGALEHEIREPLEEILTEEAFARWAHLREYDRGSAPDGSSPGGEPSGPRESVPTHGDAPARVDELNREPFAEVLALRMQEVWERRRSGSRAAPQGAFMLHLHGRWGEGKSTVLNLMRSELTSGRLGDSWVVADFNAWRHQRISPPWWMLIKETYRQARGQLASESVWRALGLWRSWTWWRVRAHWLPVLFTVLALVGTVAFGTMIFDDSEQGWGVAQVGGIILALISASAALFAASRSLVFGSARAAKTYAEMRDDPMGPIVQLFGKLIDRIERPVAIFVDDLDRCEGPYVVELLEGIQTLLRDAPVTYVVAADRAWVRSSFEEAYRSFTDTIGDAGRPLGYLFLEKLFQFSVALPGLNPDVRDRYWSRLLADEEIGRRGREQARKEAEQEAERLLVGARTEKEIRSLIHLHGSDPVLEQSLRAEGAKIMTAPETRTETEHQLEPFVRFLEPNPRSMKRLVNAYGLHQAVNLLEGRDAEFEPIVLWTILSLRWPLLADHLARHPDHLEALIHRSKPENVVLEPTLEYLFSDDAVQRVIRGRSSDGGVVLDVQAVRAIVGRSRHERSEGVR